MSNPEEICKNCNHWGDGVPVEGFNNECVPLKKLVEVCISGTLAEPEEVDDVNTPAGYGCNLWKELEARAPKTGAAPAEVTPDTLWGVQEVAWAKTVTARDEMHRLQKVWEGEGPDNQDAWDKYTEATGAWEAATKAWDAALAAWVAQ